jgi:hypothetical protein
MPQPGRPGVPQRSHEPDAVLELGRPKNEDRAGEPCKMCQNRSYKDQSSDANVSFKGGASVHPGAAAAAVFSHEQEHVANAHEKARQMGANVQTTVQIHTDICPSCKRVYVSGGSTRIMFTGMSVEPKDPSGRSFDQSA